MNEKEQGLISTENNSFRLWDLFKIMQNHLTVIVVITAIMTVLSFVKVAFFTADTYTATGILSVRSRDEANITYDSVQMNDMVTGMTMATTYVETLKTRSFLESVSDDIDNKYTYEQIASMLTLSVINETELIGIKVVALSAEDAFKVCQSVLDNAPEKLYSIYPGGSIKVVDPAYLPEKPNGRGIVLNTLIGFVLGVVLGGVYAFVCTALDVKLRNASDVNKRYNIPVIGEVPNTLSNIDKKDAAGKKFASSNNILNKDSNFSIVENYKALRTNIMYSIPKSDKGNVIAVTSAAPGEGKTTTTTNIAITFSQINAKVILVDCDLRKSKMHRYLRMKKSHGVTSVLCGFCELDEAIRKNAIGNLDVLLAGEIPPNPAELLASEAFVKMIEELREKYDYIFIDTPPVTVVTDATIVIPQTQGVVVVAKEDSTNINLLDDAISNIRAINANILGGVVICSHKTNSRYGYYKKMGYDYYSYITKD